MNYLASWKKPPVVVNFIPQEWQYYMDQVCKQCMGRIVPSECISLCKCYMFCHQKCFIKNYAPNLRADQQIKCVRCSQLIKIELSYTVRWVLVRSLAYVLSIFIGVLIWLLSLALVQSGFFDKLIPKIVCQTFLSLMLILLIIAVIKSSRQKLVFLDNIKCANTNLSEQQTLRELSKQIKQEDKEGEGEDQQRIKINLE